MTKGRFITALLSFGLGAVAGCADEVHVPQSAPPRQLFRLVAADSPDYAHGLAIAQARLAPEIMVAGPSQHTGGAPIGPEARWHIGSITKSFTATLIMRLVDRGQVRLDAPIGDYLSRHVDRMHPEWQSITLRQLLSHTAGVPANASQEAHAHAYDYDGPSGRRHVLRGMWGDALPEEPGRYLYSNVGYTLAGLVAEEVTGQTWEALIKSEIAGPLGLTSLGFGAPKGQGDPRGHSVGWFRVQAMDPQDPYADNPPWMAPAGAIHLSLKDLAAWGQAHLQACQGTRPDLLSAESCQLMRVPVRQDYGLGWVTESSGDSPVIWHNGSNTYWYAMLWLMPDRGTVIAAAVNAPDEDGIDQLVQAVSQALRRAD